ncbi:hypothetical protein ACT2FY_00935 [Paraburkholderia fungorum]|uniref:hypothetical protein n=1 Tax=Paraburkholderia fungorum TaxID=134537 RepID=UPI00402BB5D2
MQPIPLRSADAAKSIAVQEVLPLLPDDWPHRKVLNVAAALYGYDHWTHLNEAAQPNVAPFQFDQDLSYDALTARRLALAKHVEERYQIPLPYAFMLVVGSAVTRDFQRDGVPYKLLRDDAYQRALSELDWWQIVSSEYEHPLVTKGFILCRAAYVADSSRNSSAPERVGPRSIRWLDVLLLEDALAHPYRQIDSHLYLKRDQMLEIEPVPFADMVSRSYRPLQRHVARLREYGGRRDRDDWPARIKAAQTQYARLAGAAGLSAAQTRAATDALDIRARDALSEPWYWPLELCSDRDSKLAIEFERTERAKWHDPDTETPRQKTAGATHARKGAKAAKPTEPRTLDFDAAISAGLAVVLTADFANMLPLEQQPYAYQLIERLIGQVEAQGRDPSPAEDAFLRRAIALYAAAAFPEACAEAHRATVGAGDFLDGGLLELDREHSLRVTLRMAMTELLSMPQGGDVLVAARNVYRSDGTRVKLFTKDKRYEVLGALDDAWIVDDTGTNNLVSGDYLFNFRNLRRNRS